MQVKYLAKLIVATGFETKTLSVAMNFSEEYVSPRGNPIKIKTKLILMSVIVSYFNLIIIIKMFNLNFKNASSMNF